MLRLATSAAALALLAGPAHAQITVDSLDAPKAFTPGIAIDTPLDAESWRGTSAERALRLMAAMPRDTDHPVLRDMLRRVVLSGLVPPSGTEGDSNDQGGAYETARIDAARVLATPDEYARFEARNPAARDPRLRADARLARGDLDGACELSDAVQRGRGETYWVRLRAACHELRGETAAADLARDILRDRGEETNLDVPEPVDGLWAELLDLDAAALAARMTELAGEPRPLELEEEEPDSVAAPQDTVPDDPNAPIQLFAEPDPFIQPAEPDPVATFDLATALEDTSDQGTAQLFVLGRDGDAAAVSAFVDRARAAGLDPYRVLPRIPAVLDPADMARADLPLFARFAAVQRDVGLMRALYDALEPEPVVDDLSGDPTEGSVPEDEASDAPETDAALERTRERLALASDAIGGGFYGRSLGIGLETALEAQETGAQADVLIALGLGSNLDEMTEGLLDGLSRPGSTDWTDWIALDHAADRGAQAETLLRVATNLSADRDPLALYHALQALRDAGLSETAGQLAAFEYLRGL